MAAIKAADDAPVAVVWLAHPCEAAPIPPETVALRLQRAIRIHARIDEEKSAIIRHGGPADRGHEIVLSGRGLVPSTHCLRPAVNDDFSDSLLPPLFPVLNSLRMYG